MLWLAISPRGISRSALKSGRGMAVSADTYINHCLKPCLVPFIQSHYPHGGYIFWPDKVSAHYAKKTIDFLNNEGVKFVEKRDNPTETPQVRPIEDVFGMLANLVYEKNWVVKDVDMLKYRIRYCI